MHLSLVTSGSRGDVQPFIALALRLQHQGHQVRLATQSAFQSWIESHGIPFAPLHGDPQALLASDEGRALVRSRHPLAYFKAVERIAGPMLKTMLRDCQQAIHGSDAVVFTFGAIPAAYAAEKIGIPALPVSFFPLTRTRAYASTVLPYKNLGPILNGISHRLFEQAAWQPVRRTINDLRQRELGLPPLSFWGETARFYAGRHPVLYALSQNVMPIAPDWPSWHVATGFWFLSSPTSYQAPEALKAFLASGPPPIYVGFGSMKDDNPMALSRMIIDAAHHAGQRIILSRGWAGLTLDRQLQHIFLVDDVPHDWLFPRMTAVVHHGGAGTTAAAMRAGVPSIVVPYGMDQNFWAHRVHELQVGIGPLPRRQLNQTRLSQAFDQVSQDQAMQARAKLLAQSLQAEDGTGQAVRFIETFAARGKN